MLYTLRFKIMFIFVLHSFLYELSFRKYDVNKKNRINVLKFSLFALELI